MVNFLFATIERTRVTRQTDRQTQSQDRARGCVTFKRQFRVEGDIAPNLCWCQKTTVITLLTLLCSIKISAICSFLSWHTTRVTDGRADRKNYTIPYRASIAASRGKKYKYYLILIGLLAVLLAWDNLYLIVCYYVLHRYNRLSILFLTLWWYWRHNTLCSLPGLRNTSEHV